jgi:hypothetical protein
LEALIKLANGKIYSWGNDISKCGILGLGDVFSITEPKQIDSPKKYHNVIFTIKDSFQCRQDSLMQEQLTVNGRIKFIDDSRVIKGVPLGLWNQSSDRIELPGTCSDEIA